MLAARQLEPFAEMPDRQVVFAVPFEVPAGEREALGQETGIAGLASETQGLGRVAHRLDDWPVDAASRLAPQGVAAGLAGRVADLDRDREGGVHGRQDLGDLVAPVVDVGQSEQRRHFLLPVAEPADEREGPLELRHRRVELGQDEEDAAELFVNAGQLPVARRRPRATGNLQSLRVVPARLRARERVRGAVTGENAVAKRFVPLLALDEVVRQLLVMLGEAIGIEVFNRAADRLMKLLPALDEQALVGDILDHRVLEDVGRLGQAPLLVDDLQRLQLLENSLQLARESRDPLEQPAQELTADHRGELHGALALLAEPDRKSTRLNSSHGYISYAVFCLKKKTNNVSLST